MNVNIESNPVIDRLPNHLKRYIKEQSYETYSPIDQAVWRHVMKKNINYLPNVAHESYLSGLEMTGISIEEIPSLYGMNRILQKIGWAAVAVDGFIPTAAFLEFQAYKVLVIAQDIRQLNHIEYTPAPDIIHESAGHAPIIANPEYAEYLRRFGEIGCRAIPSAKDHELYEAIRHLSIVKESLFATAKQIDDAQEKVDYINNHMGVSSEMSRLRALHWWTVEYGLIGTLENPKIYGAGLLSSIGESKSCLKDDVIKLPYDISAADVAFDLSRPQPQLFVTPDFSHLSFVLEQFANTMAIRTGGSKAMEQLIDSNDIGTVCYNTGLQVSGLLTKLIKNDNNQPIYLQMTGPTALAHHEKEIIGHGILNHPHGFGSPIGRLKDINIPIENMSPFDLEAYHIKEGKFTKLSFVGGVVVEGEVITGVRTIQGKIILISFKNCTVTYRDQILFRSEWGIYDMAVGSTIDSVYSGAADFNSFDVYDKVAKETTPKVVKSVELLSLETLYNQVRSIRNNSKIDLAELTEIGNTLDTHYPDDWLLKHEIAELLED